MYTYRVLSRIPDFVPLGGMVLGGIWWITHRREEVAAAEEGHGPELIAQKESGK
jgi:formate dehydrogenase iron-sulfur subunit